MNRKVTLVAIAVAILILIVGYFYLGGLNKVEITIENVSDYNLVGMHFQGKTKSDTLETAFFEAREYVQSGELNGVLTLIHYNDTTLEEGIVKMFVGVKLNSGTSNFPDHYQRLTIPANRSIRATIEAHNVVMPSPETIEGQIKEKANELNLDLQEFTIEQYVSARELLIDMPIRQ